MSPLREATYYEKPNDFNDWEQTNPFWSSLPDVKDEYLNFISVMVTGSII